MTKTIEVLKGARKLLDAPWSWTQGFYARDESGNKRFHDDADADCFCLVGAVRYVQSVSMLASISVNPEHALMREVGVGIPLTDWNDDPDREHYQVLALLDRTIAAESAK